MAKNAKKSSGGSKAKPPTADYHRKMAQTHSAQARIHGAKADLMDAQNPPKQRKRDFPGCY